MITLCTCAYTQCSSMEICIFLYVVTINSSESVDVDESPTLDAKEISGETNLAVDESKIMHYKTFHEKKLDHLHEKHYEINIILHFGA